MKALRRDLLDRSSGSGDTAGFTLVEVLVALALIGVISSLMLSFLVQVRTIDRQRRDVLAQSEVDALGRYVEERLSGALALPLLDRDSNRRAYLVGDREGLRFVAVSRRGAYSSGLLELTVESRLSGSLSHLVQIQRPRRLVDTEAETTETVLLKGVRSVRFGYRGAGASEWASAWSAEQSLPAAISVELVVERGERSYAHNGVAVLHIARPAGLAPLDD